MTDNNMDNSTDAYRSASTRSSEVNEMFTNFAIGKYRGVVEAHELMYKNAFLHPSRRFTPYHALFYMISGVWSIAIDGDSVEKYDIYPGDVMLLPSGCSYSGYKPCTPGTRTFFIHIMPVVGDTLEGEPPQNDGIIRLPLHTIIHCQGNQMVQGLFEEITTMYNSDRPDRDETMSVMVQTLLCYLYRCDNRIMTRNHDVVDECISVMKAMPNIFFKEADMARQLFISVKTLRNSFIKRFGKTFYQYQLDYKLNQASSKLIEDPNVKLHEISYDLGFCDEFHLSKVFKKKYGISPHQYKKKMLGLDNDTPSNDE